MVKHHKQPAKRVVVKFGTNLLATADGNLNEDRVTDLVDQVAQIYKRGIEVLIVSSGSILAGRKMLPDDRRATHLKEYGTIGRQALAALGQPALMNLYERLLARHNIAPAQALISRNDLERRDGYLNIRSTLNTLLELGTIPIINENDVVSVSEIAGKVYGDNDRLSAMVANAMHAELLILLGLTEGLYSGDPHHDPAAELIPEVTDIDERIEAIAKGPRDGVGAGGMRSKIKAARVATRSGTTMVIASGLTPNAITRICDGERIGTHFPVRVSQTEARKRWLMTGFSEDRGAVLVDSGAEKAIKERGVSLLPAGIVAVVGEFKRGDIIEIQNPNKQVIAVGIANYRSDDMDLIKGRQSGELERTLNHFYGAEAIHRNNMTLV